MSTRVLLVDDHPLIVSGLQTTLSTEPSITLVGTASHGAEALALLAAEAVDVLLLDIDMPVKDGIETAKEVLTAHPDVRIVMLTMHDEPALIQRLLRLGVHGYLLKTAPPTEILTAIANVRAGRSHFAPEITLKLAQAPTDGSLAPEEALTDREMDVLKLIAEGYSNKEIGERLFISHRTVDTHRTNLMRKLDINNVAGLVRYAFQHGLVA